MEVQIRYLETVLCYSSMCVQKKNNKQPKAVRDDTHSHVQISIGLVFYHSQKRIRITQQCIKQCHGRMQKEQKKESDF